MIRINGVQQTLVAGTGVLEVLTPAVEAERMAQANRSGSLVVVRGWELVTLRAERT